MTATKSARHTSACWCDKHTRDTCKTFVGRYELNGHWGDDEETGTMFWGTRSAVDQLHAFRAGYFARVSEANQEAAERITNRKAVVHA